jgi:3-methyladenine DNA glycosylase Tag
MRSATLTQNRCSWASVNSPLLLQYQDREWGVPVHSDPKHFEVLVLSGVQAGLSWVLVLKKRQGNRRAFDKFDPGKVARYSRKQIQSLTSDPEIMRNRMKIEAAVCNARAFLKIQEEFGDFDSYCGVLSAGSYELRVCRRGPCATARAMARVVLRVLPREYTANAAGDHARERERLQALGYLGGRATVAREVPLWTAQDLGSGDNEAYIADVLAPIYLALDDRARALDQLARVLAHPYYASRATVRMDPTWQRLHGDPRFERLVAGH